MSLLPCLTAEEYSRALGLPESPQSPIYAEWLAEIEAARADDDEERAEDLFRLRCESDFFFYCWQASAMRDYRIDEAGHERFGELWITEPVMFYLCREYQYNVAFKIDDVFYTLARYMHKTTIVTVHGTCWETLCDCTMTTGLLTWKVDQVGEKMFLAVKIELESNPVLLKHWPDVLWQAGEVPELWTNRKLSVKRPSGAGEPSVSIHGMDSLPHSFHFRRVKGDDCITEDAIKTAKAKRDSLRTLRRATALGMSSSITLWVGTIWDPNDANMQLLAEGFFTKRVKVPGFTMEPEEYVHDDELLARGTPNLHTKDFWARWIRKLGPDEAACQIQLLPRAHGERQFETAWLHEACYHDKPEDVRRGLNVYFILDQAGEGDEGDHFVIRVVGLGADRHYRELDLWRERGLKTEDLFSLMFGYEEGGEMPAWIPSDWHQGLVLKWQPRVVYVEEYSTGTFGALRAEMNRRQFQFALRKLPAIKKRSKEGRIKEVRLPYKRGEFHYPARGFGHGSRLDKTDTWTQYLNQEVGVWIDDPDANECDGGLDSDAWLVQPETKNLFLFPKKKVPAAEELQELKRMTIRERLRYRGGDGDMKAPSPWAA